MFKRWFQPPVANSLLLGPRRAGKTTFLRMNFPEYRYATLDDFDFLNFAKEDPKGFVQSLGERAIIDEIQRAPWLTIAVKQAIDQGSAHILMTGSSSIGLLDSSADTLAGRIDICHFPTMCWGEDSGDPTHSLLEDEQSLPELAAASRDLEDFLKFGGFPEVMAEIDAQGKSEILRRYRNTYFTRDLAQLSNIENIEGLLAILHHLGRSTGSHLEVSNFARESGLSHPTAKKYLGVITQSELATKLYGYHFGPAKRFLKAAKMYFSDVGILTALGTEIARGQLLESFVISELEKRRKIGVFKSDQFYYYKSKGGSEIDLVYETQEGIVAIEVKSAKTVSKRDVTNLRSFMEQISDKTVKPFLFYSGTAYQEVEGVKCIPISAIRGSRL